EARQLRELERALDLPGLADHLTLALAAAADPAQAAALVGDVLRASRASLAPLWPAFGERATRLLTTLCGAAPFFARFLVRHATWLGDLATDDLVTPRAPAAYVQRLEAALGGVDYSGSAAALRRCKYYELARITVRDLWTAPGAVDDTATVLAEL